VGDDGQGGVCRFPVKDRPRTLLATNKRGRWIFIFGFEKNERANVSANELEALQTLAKDLLALTEEKIRIYKDSGKLIEVPYD